MKWYCVRTKPKAEHLASGHVKRLCNVEVFCPRIRFQRPTARGKVWFVEALFPGYLFARLSLIDHLRAVNGAPGVGGLLTFGEFRPVIPESVVDELRREFDDTETRVIAEDLEPGDEAVITDGPFRGLTAVVSRVLPARERVRVLLQCLGEIREIDASKESLSRHSTERHGPPGLAD